MYSSNAETKLQSTNRYNSTVFLDNGYYNKGMSNLTFQYNAAKLTTTAIAAHPVHAFPGYVLGGLCWFAIPWLCASTMGITALALEGTKRISQSDVTAGLVLPFAAVELLGHTGAVCSTLMLFMAVTSAFSSQLIAVSSILTYDIYQAYIDPTAKGKRLVWISHMSCVLFAVCMASFATGLYYAGIGMGYLYLLMGVIISSAVFPGAMTLLWKGQNWIAAAGSPVLGLAMSLIAWLVTAKKESGVLTVSTTGAKYVPLSLLQQHNHTNKIHQLPHARRQRRRPPQPDRLLPSLNLHLWPSKL